MKATNYVFIMMDLDRLNRVFFSSGLILFIELTQEPDSLFCLHLLLFSSFVEIILSVNDGSSKYLTNLCTSSICKRYLTYPHMQFV